MTARSWNALPFVLVVLLGVALVFSNPAFAYDEKNPMVLKCAIDNPPKDMKAVTIKRMGDEIEKRTNGRVMFKYFYGASLIKKPQFADGDRSRSRLVPGCSGCAGGSDQVGVTAGRRRSTMPVAIDHRAPSAIPTSATGSTGMTSSAAASRPSPTMGIGNILGSMDATPTAAARTASPRCIGQKKLLQIA